MAALEDVVASYQNLKREWTRTPCNLKKCGELLSQLKVIDILYPNGTMANETIADKVPSHNLIALVDVVEMDCHHLPLTLFSNFNHHSP